MFHLSDQCTIQRYTASADPYSNETRTPEDWARFVPCKLITDKDQYVDALTGQPTIATSYKVLMKPDQDVIAGDRLTDFIDRGGNSIAGDYEVMAVIPRNGQMSRLTELMVNKVT